MARSVAYTRSGVSEQELYDQECFGLVAAKDRFIIEKYRIDEPAL